jgi:hypothetical protein
MPEGVASRLAVSNGAMKPTMAGKALESIGEELAEIGPSTAGKRGMHADAAHERESNRRRAAVRRVDSWMAGITRNVEGQNARRVMH